MVGLSSATEGESSDPECTNLGHCFVPTNQLCTLWLTHYSQLVDWNKTLVWNHTFWTYTLHFWFARPHPGWIQRLSMGHNNPVLHIPSNVSPIGRCPCLEDPDNGLEISHVKTGQLQVKIAIMPQTVGQILPTRLTRSVFLARALRYREKREDAHCPDTDSGINKASRSTALPCGGPGLRRAAACGWCPGCRGSCWPPGCEPAAASAPPISSRNRCGFCTAEEKNARGHQDNMRHACEVYHFCSHDTT